MSEESFPVRIGELWEYVYDEDFYFLVLGIRTNDSNYIDYHVEGLFINDSPSEVRLTNTSRIVSGGEVADHRYLCKINEFKINGKTIIIDE